MKSWEEVEGGDTRTHRKHTHQRRQRRRRRKTVERGEYDGSGDDDCGGEPSMNASSFSGFSLEDGATTSGQTRTPNSSQSSPNNLRNTRQLQS